MSSNWTIKQAKSYLKTLNFVITYYDGEYRVKPKGAAESQAYYTSSIEDAIETAEAIYYGFIEAYAVLPRDTFREIVDRIDNEYGLTTREVRMQARKMALNHALWVARDKKRDHDFPLTTRGVR